MIELTIEQRQAVAQPGQNLIRAIDPDTQTTYVLIREELFDRLKTLLLEEDTQFINDMYPHAMEVFGRTGWDDPSMDVYNDLDPRKPS